MRENKKNCVTIENTTEEGTIEKKTGLRIMSTHIIMIKYRNTLTLILINHIQGNQGTQGPAGTIPMIEEITTLMTTDQEETIEEVMTTITHVAIVTMVLNQLGMKMTTVMAGKEMIKTLILADIDKDISNLSIWPAHFTFYFYCTISLEILDPLHGPGKDVWLQYILKLHSIPTIDSLLSLEIKSRSVGKVWIF